MTEIVESDDGPKGLNVGDNRGSGSFGVVESVYRIERKGAHRPTLRIEDEAAPLLPAPLREIWHVAMIGPDGEAMTAAALGRAGHAVWWPQTTRWIMPHGTAGRVKRRVHRPLFPGYLFVSPGESDAGRRRACLLRYDPRHAALIDGRVVMAATRSAHRARGITACGSWVRLMRDGDGPARLSPAVVQALSDAQQTGRLDETGIQGALAAEQRPKAGQPEVGRWITLLVGPYASMSGRVVLSEPERIRILVDLLGKAHPVDIHPAALEPSAWGHAASSGHQAGLDEGRESLA